MSGKLKAEIGKANGFDSLEQEVFLNLQRTADALMGGVNELFKPHGISAAQYNVLRILRGAGAGCCGGGRVDAAAPGLACGEIGARMIARDPDLTRLLDRLEARGLVSRCREADDRRKVATRITAAGLDLLEALDEPVLALHKRQLGHLGKRRLGELRDLLEEARSGAES